MPMLNTSSFKAGMMHSFYIGGQISNSSTNMPFLRKTNTDSHIKRGQLPVSTNFTKYWHTYKLFYKIIFTHFQIKKETLSSYFKNWGIPHCPNFTKKKVGSHPPPLNNIPILKAQLFNVVKNHGDIFRTVISLNTSLGRQTWTTTPIQPISQKS